MRHDFEDRVIGLSFPFWFFSLMKWNYSFLCSYEYSFTNPANTGCHSWCFAIVKRIIDTFVPDQAEIIQCQNNLCIIFDFHTSQGLDIRRAVIDILLLALTIIAEQITTAHHVDILVLHI